MSAEYVRRYYGVPAKRGMRVSVNGRPGCIVGFTGQYLRVKWETGARSRRSEPVHATWRVTYLSDTGRVLWSAHDEIERALLEARQALKDAQTVLQRLIAERDGDTREDAP